MHAFCGGTDDRRRTGGVPFFTMVFHISQLGLPANGAYSLALSEVIEAGQEGSHLGYSAFIILKYRGEIKSVELSRVNGSARHNGI